MFFLNYIRKYAIIKVPLAITWFFVQVTENSAHPLKPSVTEVHSYPMLADIWKSIAFWDAPRLRPLALLERATCRWRSKECHLTGERRSNVRKTCLSATLSTTIRLRGERPAINRLNQGTAPVKTKINRLTPNDPYMGRTAPLTSKRCILYIYSTNIGTEYFKHALYSPFFLSLQNAVCFITLTCLVPVLLTFYIQGVLKIKKKIPAPKG